MQDDEVCIATLRNIHRLKRTFKGHVKNFIQGKQNILSTVSRNLYFHKSIS